jgi:hypothetical protein
MFSKRSPGVFPPATADPGRLQSAEMSISKAHFCRMTPVCAVDPIAAATIVSTWHLLLYPGIGTSTHVTAHAAFICIS